MPHLDDDQTAILHFLESSPGCTGARLWAACAPASALSYAAWSKARDGLLIASYVKVKRIPRAGGLGTMNRWYLAKKGEKYLERQRRRML